MSAFWDGFDKRAEEVISLPMSNPITPRETNFMSQVGVPSKNRGKDHVTYDDMYSTNGSFGY